MCGDMGETITAAVLLTAPAYPPPPPLSQVVWFRYTAAHRSDMHKIHHLMGLLLVLKTTSVLCHALMFHWIDVTGHSTGWNVVYYIVTFARGLLMISVLALIGAGWSLLKPFLNGRERKVMLVAIPLQVINNIAIIVTDEMAPGSLGYVAWCVVVCGVWRVARGVECVCVYGWAWIVWGVK